MWSRKKTKLIDEMFGKVNLNEDKFTTRKENVKSLILSLCPNFETAIKEELVKQLNDKKINILEKNSLKLIKMIATMKTQNSELQSEMERDIKAVKLELEKLKVKYIYLF